MQYGYIWFEPITSIPVIKGETPSQQTNPTLQPT